MSLLTEKQIEDFNCHGFLVIDNLFLEADLNQFVFALRRTIQFQLSRARKKNPSIIDVPFGKECDLGMQTLEEVDHQFIAHINDCLYGMPEVLRLISTQSLRSIVNQLLGKCEEAPLFCTNNAVVLAAPDDKAHTHGWHKDTFFTLPNSEYIQIWAPLLQDATIEMGTLRVCPGSHKQTWKGQQLVQNTGYIHRYQVTHEELKKYIPFDVEMKLGQTLFFHSGLAHSAGNNISPTTRFSLVGVFHQIENELFSPKAKKTADEYFQELYS